MKPLQPEGKITITWTRGDRIIGQREYRGYDMLRLTRMVAHEIKMLTRNWTSFLEERS